MCERFFPMSTLVNYAIKKEEKNEYGKGCKFLWLQFVKMSSKDSKIQFCNPISDHRWRTDERLSKSETDGGKVR